MDLPSRKTCPGAGASRPLATVATVVFPTPDSPTSATVRPLWKRVLGLSTATDYPNPTCTLTMSLTGVSRAVGDGLAGDRHFRTDYSV